jgi:hypothetical protein
VWHSDYDKGFNVKRLSMFIFSGLTVLSLFLCLTTVGFWVRGYWVYDRFDYGLVLAKDPATGHHVFAESRHGGLCGAYGYLSAQNYDGRQDPSWSANHALMSYPTLAIFRRYSDSKHFTTAMLRRRGIRKPGVRQCLTGSW